MTDERKSTTLAMCEYFTHFIFVWLLMTSSVQDIKKNIDDRAEREAKSGNTEKAEAGEQADEALELLESLIMNLQRGNAESCFRLPVDHSADHAELHVPSLGIPEQFEVEAGYKVLLLKPQITLRSEADQDAIILLAVEELTSKTFHVLDPAAQGEKKDKNVRNGEVLDRYVQVSRKVLVTDVIGITCR